MDLSISQLLDLSRTMAGKYLKQFAYPWRALDPGTVIGSVGSVRSVYPTSSVRGVVPAGSNCKGCGNVVPRT